jgi:DNA-3-methyladenine glycosylase II
MTLDPGEVAAGVIHLGRADPVMRQLIQRSGPFTLKLQRDRFAMLVRSIIWQQISMRAAQSIYARLKDEAGKIKPDILANMSPERFRRAGVSPQKTAYLLDLSRNLLEGAVRLTGLSRKTDAEIIVELVRVKGIGVWTAQMFLIFSLGRLDVFPGDDLGIRMALRNLYGLNELPDKVVSERLAGVWKPYSTVASWYCWRSLEANS